MELTCPLITRISRYYYSYLNKALEPYGINSSQYLYIIIICKEAGIKQCDLPKRIGINKSNVSRCLDQLENDDFIYRVCDKQDKRSSNIFPTQKSYNIYPLIMDIIKKWDSYVTRLIPNSNIESLQNMLKIMANESKTLL